MAIPEVKDFAKDLIGDLKSAWLERVSNPLTGALLMSWLAVNHKIFFVLFSSTDYKASFKYIDEALYPDMNIWMLKIIVLPCLFAALYIYVLPFPAEKVYRWTLQRKRALAIAEQEAAGEQVLSVKRSSEILEAAKFADELRAQAEASIEGLRVAHGDELVRLEARFERELAEARGELSACREAGIADEGRYKRALANQKWHLIVLEAVSQALDPSSSARSGLQAFLTARPFQLVFGPHYPDATISFKSDGSVRETHQRRGVQWRLTPQDRLTILGENGATYGEFDFVASTAMWTGYYGADSNVLLKHEPIEVPHETERDR